EEDTGRNRDSLSPPFDDVNDDDENDSNDSYSSDADEGGAGQLGEQELDPAVWCLLDRVGRRHWLNSDGLLLIGREDCSLMLKSHSVDPQHAVMTYDSELGLYRVKDLGTVNGTFVNESRIAEDTYVYLNNGDSLRFGYDSNVFRVQRFSPTTAAATTSSAASSTPPSAAPSASVPATAASAMKKSEHPPVVSRPSLSGLPEWATGAAKGVSAMAECPACTQGSEEFRRSSADLSRLCLFHQKELDRVSTAASMPSPGQQSVAPATAATSSKPAVTASVTASVAGMQDPGFSKDSLNFNSNNTTQNSNASKDGAKEASCSRNNFSRGVERKKIKELYGQPDWWGTDDADEEREQQSAKQKKQQQPPPPPPPPQPASPPRRMPNRHAEAFTVALDPSAEDPTSSTECVAGDGGGGGTGFVAGSGVGGGSGDGLQVTDSLSRFVPSKIRKSFQERQEMKRKKVEELRERTRQQQQQQVPPSASVAKRPIAASRQSSAPLAPGAVTKPTSGGASAPSRNARSVSGTGSGGKALLFDRLLNSNSRVGGGGGGGGGAATDRRRTSAKSGAASSTGGGGAASRISIRDKPLPPPPPPSKKQQKQKPQQQQQQQQHPLSERDLYSEAAQYEDEQPDEDNEDAASETGTYTISESGSAHEDAEFRHLEALADSLDAGQELELRAGPKWVTDMVSVNGAAGVDAAASTAATTTAAAPKPASPVVALRRDSEASDDTCHQSQVSDVLSSGPIDEERNNKQQLLDEQQRSVSLDTACLLQDTATVLHHMEARLATRAGGPEPENDISNAALSDQTALPTSHSLRSRLSALRVAKSQQQQQQQKSTASSRQAFEYGRHSLKMPASSTHPPPVSRNAVTAAAATVTSATISTPHRILSAGSPSAWRGGRRPESLHEALATSAAAAGRPSLRGSAEDVRASRDARHRGGGGTDLSRDLERLARREDLSGLGAAAGRQSSAFSPTTSNNNSSRSPSSSVVVVGGGGGGTCDCACHHEAGRQQQLRREVAAYDSVLLSSLVRMSCKLRRCSDGLLGRLRSSRHLSRTPSPAEDVLLNSPDAAGASSAAAAAPGASAEGRSSDLQDNLQSCLYNLQAVQYHIQIIERAIFPQAQSGRNSALGSCSEGDYLAERERINSEVRGFQPIEPAFPATQLKFYTDYK
ncbi:hypothetical protein BOX15_Mlig018398g1, partial [Macrostomum lignano]